MILICKRLHTFHHNNLRARFYAQRLCAAYTYKDISICSGGSDGRREKIKTIRYRAQQIMLFHVVREETLCALD